MKFKKPIALLLLSSALFLTACSDDIVATDTKESVIDETIDKKVEVNKEVDEKEAQATAEYRGFMDTHTKNLDKLVSELDGQLTEFSTNSDWVADAVGQLISLRGLTESATDFENVPVLYADVHKEYLKGMVDFRIAADNLAVAIDTDDAELVDSIKLNLTHGKEYVDKTTEMMSELESN